MQRKRNQGTVAQVRFIRSLQQKHQQKKLGVELEPETFWARSQTLIDIIITHFFLRKCTIPLAHHLSQITITLAHHHFSQIMISLAHHLSLRKQTSQQTPLSTSSYPLAHTLHRYPPAPYRYPPAPYAHPPAPYLYSPAPSPCIISPIYPKYTLFPTPSPFFYP